MARRSNNSTDIGCIWGLINMFNFRRGSSKMLPEKRSRMKKRFGSWYSRSRVKLLTEPEKRHDVVECVQDGVGGQSVKKSMEKEMSNRKKAKHYVGAECDQIDSIYPPVQCNNSSRTHQKSHVVHTAHSNESTHETIPELVERISNNMAIVLEELCIPRKKDPKAYICPGRDAHHEIKDAEAYHHSGPANMKLFQDHFVLQVLEALICNDIFLAKHIVSQCLSRQSEEIRTLLEILSSNKELLLRVLQDAKPNLIKHVQDQQCGSGKKTFKDISHNHACENDLSEHDNDVSGLPESFNIHEPLLKDKSVEVPQSRKRIVILKPHPSGDRNSSSVSVPTPNEMQLLFEKEKSPLPIFFQDIKRRLREFLGNNKKDQSSGESSSTSEQESLSADIPKQGTTLTLKEPCTNGESEITVKASDTDTMYTSDEAIYPRKPEIDFVDLLEYGDDNKLTFLVSKSSRNLFLLSEHSQSCSQNSSGKHEDIIMDIDNTTSHDARQETDLNFFRSSILNLETLTSTGADASQMPNSSSNAQVQVAFSDGQISTQKDFLSSTENGVASLPNTHSNEASNADSLFSGESGQDGSCSKLKPQPHTPVVPSHDAKPSGVDGIKSEKSSPISVLEPVFFERFVSRGSLPAKRGKIAMQPRRITFGDSSFSESGRLPMIDLEDQTTNCVGNEKFKYEYLQSLLDASGLCDGDIHEKLKSPHQLLDPALYDEVETPCEEIPDDLRLFFDSVNEVLVDIYEKSSSPLPWVTFYRKSVLPFPAGESLRKEAWRGLNSVFIPWSSTTLDEIVEKEFETRSWMDIRNGAEETGFDFSDAILETLLEEAIHELCEFARL